MKPRCISAFRLHSEEGVEADRELDPVVALHIVSLDGAMKSSAGAWALSMPQKSILEAERQPNSCSSDVRGRVLCADVQFGTAVIRWLIRVRECNAG